MLYLGKVNLTSVEISELYNVVDVLLMITVRTTKINPGAKIRAKPLDRRDAGSNFDPGKNFSACKSNFDVEYNATAEKDIQPFTALCAK